MSCKAEPNMKQHVPLLAHRSWTEHTTNKRFGLEPMRQPLSLLSAVSFSRLFLSSRWELLSQGHTPCAHEGAPTDGGVAQ